MKRAGRGGTLRSMFVLAATDFDDQAGDDVERVKGAAAGASAGEDKFCPLTGFDAGAVEWSLPEGLRELEARERGRGAAARGGAPPVNALRVWVRAHRGPPPPAAPTGVPTTAPPCAPA